MAVVEYFERHAAQKTEPSSSLFKRSSMIAVAGKKERNQKSKIMKKDTATSPVVKNSIFVGYRKRIRSPQKTSIIYNLWYKYESRRIYYNNSNKDNNDLNDKNDANNDEVDEWLEVDEMEVNESTFVDKPHVVRELEMDEVEDPEIVESEVTDPVVEVERPEVEDPEIVELEVTEPEVDKKTKLENVFFGEYLAGNNLYDQNEEQKSSKETVPILKNETILVDEVSEVVVSNNNKENTQDNNCFDDNLYDQNKEQESTKESVPILKDETIIVDEVSEVVVSDNNKKNTQNNNCFDENMNNAFSDDINNRRLQSPKRNNNIIIKMVRFADECGKELESSQSPPFYDDDDDIDSSSRVIILLLSPKKKMFEFIHVSYGTTDKTSISNVIKQLGNFTTNKTLKKQTYVGLLRNKNDREELINTFPIQSYNFSKNEILIAVVKGCYGSSMMRMAKSIMEDRRMMKAVKMSLKVSVNKVESMPKRKRSNTI